MEQCTLQRCENLHAKLQRDLVALTLLAESRQNLEIVTHSLDELVNVYKNLGPTTDTFVEVMRKRKEIVMGPNKCKDVKQRGIKEMAKSMFNFKGRAKNKSVEGAIFQAPKYSSLFA